MTILSHENQIWNTFFVVPMTIVSKEIESMTISMGIELQLYSQFKWHCK